METLELTLSITAIVFSLISFYLSFRFTRKSHEHDSRLQDAIFHMERNDFFEGKLAEWPDAFKFYGVNLDSAKKDGVSKEQIAYLVMSINALTSLSQSKGQTLAETLMNNTYRFKMFSHKETQTAWKYARKCFSDQTVEGIDIYLRDNFGLRITLI